MGYNSLPEEGIEALTEHALGNYLPFNGGFRQHYQLRNFGRRGKPKKGAKFYAVEYRPHPDDIYIEKSPIYLKDEKTFNSFDQMLLVDDRKINADIWGDDPEKQKNADEIDDYYNRIKFYKWGTERGFDFYGYTKWNDSKELQKIKAIPYKKMKKKDWEEQKRLEDMEYKKDITLHDKLRYKYPSQSFFKIGLTNTTAEKRGMFTVPNSERKTTPNPYKKIFIEKDLTYLFEKIHPADLEVFIYFHLFYKYWKDKLFYFSANKINICPNPIHQQIKFTGYTESFLLEKVEDKLKIINDAFDLIDQLTKRKINTMLQNMINFDRVWNRACLQKHFFINQFDFDNSSSYGFDNWVFTDRIGYSFYEKIGFWEKYIPKNTNKIKEIDDNKIKDLFDKKVEEFILPNSKHLPEIPNLEYFYDYSYSDV